MKWFLVLALGLLGCGDDPPPTVSGGGTRVPGGTIGETGGTPGAGGSGGAGGAGGAQPKGACDNGSDLDAIEAAEQSVRDIARNCGLFVCAASIGNATAYGECVEGCVSERVPALSTDCAGCYGDLESCGLASLCRFQCQGSTCSTLCLDCLNGADCLTAFEECRGLPGDGCAG
ncbi:MAG: hypothetical protein KJO40_09735 [Deltaproteobacteria bacterium]|nr:hypothetical protein [Deltaproteobacteria bacterium]NND30426.1 hypothetical protein [Myxococcales bacterium]MBT8466783.1 hypothetical protein [Deltaproteobacteria bacterium]MBT8483833.1 hypothetical protein [Deltaproteobacteria bacterium]NNK09366.1 hypothetical protein [Myxococcales bacterium]